LKTSGVNEVFVSFIITQLACSHDQNKSGFFGGPTFFQPIRAFWKSFQIALIGWIKSGPPKKATLVLIM